MPVLDASTALELLLKTPRGERAALRVLNPNESLHAPYLLEIEFLHALRRLNHSGGLSAAVAQQAIGDLDDLPLWLHPQGELLMRIWELRSSLTAYDAAYVALAELLEMPLITCDAKLARSHGHRARIEVLV
jgi:predicted nucleic acid-binding protein